MEKLGSQAYMQAYTQVYEDGYRKGFTDACNWIEVTQGLPQISDFLWRTYPQVLVRNTTGLVELFTINTQDDIKRLAKTYRSWRHI